MDKRLGKCKSYTFNTLKKQRALVKLSYFRIHHSVVYEYNQTTWMAQVGSACFIPGKCVGR